MMMAWYMVLSSWYFCAQYVLRQLPKSNSNVLYVLLRCAQVLGPSCSLDMERLGGFAAPSDGDPKMYCMSLQTSIALYKFERNWCSPATLFVSDLALEYVLLAAGVAYVQHDERTKVKQYVAVCTSSSRNSSFGWAMCPDPLLISTWSLDMCNIAEQIITH